MAMKDKPPAAEKEFILRLIPTLAGGDEVCRGARFKDIHDSFVQECNDRPRAVLNKMAQEKSILIVRAEWSSRLGHVRFDTIRFLNRLPAKGAQGKIVLIYCRDTLPPLIQEKLKQCGS